MHTRRRLAATAASLVVASGALVVISAPASSAGALSCGIARITGSAGHQGAYASCDAMGVKWKIAINCYGNGVHYRHFGNVIKADKSGVSTAWCDTNGVIEDGGIDIVPA
ncbi:hypothetical protein [Streptomyces varsoviensis]|uniref:Secreted protein n=1 Tax=Streptomyces varsoviensis TaxID=67373 RepID=A0ABR5IV11_9ACTN|nr:hypothetical protein [Streptomyces varsoviensis]KOG80754.1 hypothetical protein ADK38_39150 [Streptomyces varsoviensis]